MFTTIHCVMCGLSSDLLGRPLFDIVAQTKCLCLFLIKEIA